MSCMVGDGRGTWLHTNLFVVCYFFLSDCLFVCLSVCLSASLPARPPVGRPASCHYFVFPPVTISFSHESAEKMGLAISLVATEKERVWFCQKGIKGRGALSCCMSLTYHPTPEHYPKSG